jgi:alpha-L-fucosidase
MVGITLMSNFMPIIFTTMKNCMAIVLCFYAYVAGAQTSKGICPLPKPAQWQWHHMEYYWFIHFGPNTFTNKEWGHGDEPAAVFNPKQLDCNQWARAAKAAGAKGIIITAKHHDGFCLWPSQYSTHTVQLSPWKNGKGDVLKDLSLACKKYGLMFGVYLSPWDRNHPQYGTTAYNQVYVNMMKELFKRYSPIWEFWWDGANGEGPNGKKQQYDWELFRKTVKDLSPATVVFSDVGPHIRWVGNENGIAGLTNWNLMNTKGFSPGAGAPPNDTLTTGNINGENWIPAECDVSIRPGWFYHAAEDSLVKTPRQLFALYLKSVGRGANLLLNVPPDTNGLIHKTDMQNTLLFRKMVESNFKNNRCRQAKVVVTTAKANANTTKLSDGNINSYVKVAIAQQSSVEIVFKQPERINTIQLQEALKLGQQVMAFTLYLKDKAGNTLHTVQGTTIGHKRILTFPTQLVASFTLAVTAAKATPTLAEIAAFNIDESLLEL